MPLKISISLIWLTESSGQNKKVKKPAFFWLFRGIIKMSMTNTPTTKSVTNHRSSRLDPETQRSSLALRCPALQSWIQNADIKAIKLIRKMVSAGWSFELVDGNPEATYRFIRKKCA